MNKIELWNLPLSKDFINARLVHLAKRTLEEVAVFTAPWTPMPLEDSAHIRYFSTFQDKTFAILIQTSSTQLRLEILGVIPDFLTTPYRKSDFTSKLPPKNTGVRLLALSALERPTKIGLEAAEIALLCHGNPEALELWRTKSNFSKFSKASSKVMAILGEEIATYILQ